MPKPHVGSEVVIKAPGERADVSRKGTQSIGRAVSVLRATAMMGRHGIRIDEISRLTAMPKTTCARIVRRLVDEGLAHRDDRTHKLYLGPMLHQLGLLAQPRSALKVFCGESLDRLAALFDDAVYLSERVGLEAVTLERQLGTRQLAALALDIGIRRPLGVATGGIAMLANMSEADTHAVIQAIGGQYQRYGGLDAALVEARVRAARAAGYASGEAYGNPGARSVSIGFQIAGTNMALSVTEFNPHWQNGRAMEIASAIGSEISIILARFATAAHKG